MGNIRRGKWHRNKIRANLTELPASYYIQRGYSPQILDAYDVGFYKPQYRVVVPVYDDSGVMAVGFVKRSIFDKCEKCKTYHDPSQECPQQNKQMFSKWRSSQDFHTRYHLYNLWNARKHIVESGTIILVEGPGDVWKCVEAGIHNVVGLFGCELHDPQISLLESLWIMNIVVLLDDDDAGKRGKIKIMKSLSNIYNLYFPDMNGKDPGNMTRDELREIVRSIA